MKERIMKAHKLCWALMASVLIQCNGCMIDKDMNQDLQVQSESKHYSPGFTGYTSGYGGYGGYLNGYGPSFWNPRYYYYTNYGQGFPSGG